MDKYKEKIAALRAEAEEAVARAEEAEKELTTIKDEISAKDQEGISLKNRVELLTAQLEKTETGGSDSQHQVRALEAKVEELESRVGRLEAEKETLETEYEEVTGEYAMLQAAYNEAEASLNDL